VPAEPARLSIYAHAISGSRDRLARGRSSGGSDHRGREPDLRTGTRGGEPTFCAHADVGTSISGAWRRGSRGARGMPAAGKERV
jgi:hypothetical protein